MTFISPVRVQTTMQPRFGMTLTASDKAFVELYQVSEEETRAYFTEAEGQLTHSLRQVTDAIRSSRPEFAVTSYVDTVRLAHRLTNERLLMHQSGKNTLLWGELYGQLNKKIYRDDTGALTQLAQFMDRDSIVGTFKMLEKLPIKVTLKDTEALRQRMRSLLSEAENQRIDRELLKKTTEIQQREMEANTGTENAPIVTLPSVGAIHVFEQAPDIDGSDRQLDLTTEVPGPGEPTGPLTDVALVSTPATETIADDPERMEDVFQAYLKHIRAFVTAGEVDIPGVVGGESPDEELMTAVESKLGILNANEVFQKRAFILAELGPNPTLDSNVAIHEAIAQQSKNLTWNTDFSRPRT